MKYSFHMRIGIYRSNLQIQECHKLFKCYVLQRLLKTNVLQRQIAFELPCFFSIVIYCNAKHSG